MKVRSLAFRTDLMVRRLAGSTIVDRGDHLVVHTPQNPWYYWGNFLLLEAPPVGAAIEEWIARFDQEFPGAGHVTLGIDGNQFRPPLEFPSSVGLEVDLGVVLTGGRPPTPCPLADEYAVRPLRTAQDWHEELRLRQEEGAEKGRLMAGHSEFLERSTAEAARLTEQGWAAYVGAFEGDRLRSVTGIVSDRRGVARYQNVATHREHRRRGLASRLVAEAGVLAVSTLGAARLVIVADNGGPAARLYQSLGFTLSETQLGLSVSRSTEEEGPASRSWGAGQPFEPEDG